MWETMHIMLREKKKRKNMLTMFNRLIYRLFLRRAINQIKNFTLVFGFHRTVQGTLHL